MNRDLKFRGKVGVNWEYAVMGEDNDTEDDANWEHFWYVVDRKTVGEYTDCKDKEEKGIYDGDIIKVVGMYGEVKYAKVIWGPVKNMYTWMNGETWLLHFDSGAEGPLYPYCQPHHGYGVSVAGNIYEHPELLEVKV